MVPLKKKYSCHRARVWAKISEIIFPILSPKPCD
ncbi:hypothetical protein Patl1_22388 [Pistacia atlantica]|uniref:Uncharacterized protein n=1 Tax=Pistacia atlantica TaxID=434234 RepID=A0ACC0ZYP1_9ROSI|nr:hypothetical protein Patl1_22388 [Pistacia atlantica]